MKLWGLMNFPDRACFRPPGSLVCTTTTCVGRIGRRYLTGAKKSGIPPVRSPGVVHRGYAGCWIQPSENSILPRRSVPPVPKTFVCETHPEEFFAKRFYA